ncbi:hypothetical protein LINPERPRIM_LOCUS358 [Linum perenne]
MEQNLPLMTKKAWGILRVLFFMLRKGIISKRKLLLDLNMVMKRGNKIASKAISNLLIFNHHNRNDAPPTKHDDDVDTVNAVKMALEMFNGNGPIYAPSPMLPGFGKSPVGRQLRITDSPFPLKEEDQGDNGVVDKKATDFIANFYRDLHNQRGFMD